MKNLTQTFLILAILCLATACQSSKKEMTFTTSSDEARDLFIQGRDLIEQGEAAKGNELVKKAIERDSGFAMAHAWLYTREALDRALQLVGKVSPAEAYEIRCFDAHNRTDFKAAEQYMDSLLDLFPKDKHVLFAAGSVYNNHDRNRSIGYYDQAIAMDSNYAAPYLQKGYQLLYQEKLDGAEAALSKFVDLAPESANAQDSYGDLLSTLGRYDEAISYFRKAYELDKTFTSTFYKIGWLQIRKGEFDRARTTFDEYSIAALNDNERYAAVLYKALSSYVEEDFDGADAGMEALRELASSEGNNVQFINSYRIQAWMLLERGDPKGAVSLVEKALELTSSMELSPEKKVPLEMYCHGDLSLVYGFNGDIPKAGAELTQAKTIFDNRTNNLGDKTFMNLYAAGLEINKGNFDKAIDLLSLGAGGTSVSSFYYTGLAYDKAGNADKAIEYYTKAYESRNPSFTAFFYNKTRRRIEELKSR